MNFDEAIERVNEISYDEATDVWFEKEDLFSLINDLREEYAPTVEMGHQQAKIFASYYHPEKPLNKNKFDYPDSLIMKSISEKDLVQAWLHPETIKVVDE